MAGSPNGHSPRAENRRHKVVNTLVGKHAWKADFNQCTGRQLIRALNRGADRYAGAAASVPFVLIGHSKLFTGWNERSLRPFLAYVAANRPRFDFGTFDSLGLTPTSDDARLHFS